MDADVICVRGATCEQLERQVIWDGSGSLLKSFPRKETSFCIYQRYS
jgi:hypothetical protein